MGSFLNKCASFGFTLIAIGCCCCAAWAHDTWVQTNTNVVRVGDVVHVDLLMGNHGNNHRDFKIAGKASIADGAFEVISPDGNHTDLRPAAVDLGLAEKDGFWSAPFQTAAEGIHIVAQTSDKVVSYAPARSIKSAKTFFLASKSLDRVPSETSGYDRVLGHALELVPLTNPVAPMGPGSAIRVRLLFKGKPLANAVVSFIPRGKKLSENFDDRYERKTDADGMATFEFAEPTYHLIVAHHEEPTESGDGYESTKYSATLSVFVPAICPCCGE